MDPERFKLERRVGAILIALIRCDDPVVSLRAIEVLRRAMVDRTRRSRVGVPSGGVGDGQAGRARTNWEPS